MTQLLEADDVHERKKSSKNVESVQDENRSHLPTENVHEEEKLENCEAFGLVFLEKEKNQVGMPACVPTMMVLLSCVAL